MRGHCLKLPWIEKAGTGQGTNESGNARLASIKVRALIADVGGSNQASEERAARAKHRPQGRKSKQFQAL